MDNKLKFKKGQAEMFGLLFIVVLITIALILVAQAEVNKKPSELKKNFEKSEIATNTINTLIKTRTQGCNELDLGELYTDCARNPINPRFICDDGSNSCQYAKIVTQEILSKTLDVWKKKYFLNMSNGKDDILILASSDACTWQDRKVEVVPLPLDPGTLTIEMWICG